MTKKKSKKKIRKKQKSFKTGLAQVKEEKEKENPDQEAEKSRKPDPLEPEHQKLAKKLQRSTVISKMRIIASVVRLPSISLWRSLR